MNVKTLKTFKGASSKSFLLLGGVFLLLLTSTLIFSSCNGEKEEATLNPETDIMATEEASGGGESKNQEEMKRRGIEGDDSKEQDLTKASEEKIDTSNWKTYRNEELGFEFRYPGEWEVAEVEGDVFVVLKGGDEKFFKENGKEILKIIYLKDINDEIHLKNVGEKVRSLDEFFEKDLAVTEICKLDEATVKGSPVHITVSTGFVSNYSLFLEGSGGVVQFIFFQDGPSGEMEMRDVCINKVAKSVNVNLKEVLLSKQYLVLESFSFLE
jgi:hypothetical protein